MGSLINRPGQSMIVFTNLAPLILNCLVWRRQKVLVFRLFFAHLKKSRAKKLKKSPPPKKLKGHFEQKTQCVGVNLRFQQKKLKKCWQFKANSNWFYDNKWNFQRFFDKFGWKLTYLEGNIWIFKKKPQRFWEKLKAFEKETQSYGVDLTQSDSLKSVKTMPANCF